MKSIEQFENGQVVLAPSVVIVCMSRDILTYLHSCLYHLKPTPTIPAPPAYIPTFLLVSKSSKSTRTSLHHSA